MTPTLLTARRGLAVTLLGVPLLTLATPVANSVDGSFGLGSDVNIFNSTTVAHTTVTGTLDAGNVNWYSFAGKAGATVYADHDGGSLQDSWLHLFRSSGELIARADDSFVPDPGSSSGLNAFLGAFALTADDTYYVAISVSARIADRTGCSFPNLLLRPDHISGEVGREGGFRSTGCTDRSFGFAGTSFGSGSYTLHISNSMPTNGVPEPASWLLAGLGVLAASAARRRT